MKKKEQLSIPVTKVQRASKFLKTGAKVGGNYIKHYSRKLFDPELSRESLDEENAEDIYASLSELKGGALKVAQMMSMDKNVLPTAFQTKFALSQYNAPPLSYPLVVKTFKKYFDKSPEDIFDSFSREAINAASIGQVHKATLDGKELAVKVQYPGVAASISSDLKMIRPIATTMFKINASEIEEFIIEVESKLIEETNYTLELERSIEITKLCSEIEGLVFPTYYPKHSSERVLVMDWIDGLHIEEWAQTNPSQEDRNNVGQALWNFYDYQIHTLKQVHADPHPGNFIITKEGKVGVIDFGCVKIIPEDFYEKFFLLMNNDFMNNDFNVEKLFLELGFLSADDTKKEKLFFVDLFKEMIVLLNRPFRSATFNFSDGEYLKEIFAAGERLSKMKELRNSTSARGNKHGLYLNRAYFGLYNILNDIKAEVRTSDPVLLS